MEVDRQLGSAAGTPSPAADRRVLVFPDPVAFRFLLDDPCVTVVHRKERLEGYELYLVEQWACSRIQPTTVIVTYTGDNAHSVAVGVLSVPRDEVAWSDQLRVYVKAVQQYHARPKDTPLGELMVTNLSSFPSALTVIAVPGGDIKKHRSAFVVNENLKRLGCSGRSGMSLSEPTAAARAKFYQLYKVNDKIPFDQAVVELVKLCQVALYLFDTLHAAYVDGLLCDITERALTDWWTEYGADYYNMEPADGILGPTSVAALLGLCAGARNRLSYLNAPVSKDVFDVDATERGIAYFQKYQKLERSRRLDRQTMHKLHNATAKAAAGEGWGVQKAVKSTVTEIGGKRGEIVLGMVGGRDKGGIADIESLDLDRFISLVSGERAKWLWLGKPKRPGVDINNEHGSPTREDLLGKDEGAVPSRRPQITPQDDQADPLRKDEFGEVYASPAPGSAISINESPGNNKDQLRRGVLKSVARDARSGLGRIKDAVSGSGRNHGSRPSRDETDGFLSPHSGTSAGHGPTPGSAPGQINRAFTWKNKPEEYLASMRELQNDPKLPSTRHDAVTSSPKDYQGRVIQSTDEATGTFAQDTTLPQARLKGSGSSDQQLETGHIESSVANSTADEGELRIREHEKRLPELAGSKGPATLQRRKSAAYLSDMYRPLPDENRWPRRMSFGDAEEAVLRWEPIVNLLDTTNQTMDAATVDGFGLGEVAAALYDDVLYVKTSVEPWVTNKIGAVQAMEQEYSRQAEKLEALYYQQSEAFRHTKHDSQDLLSQERSHLTEASGNLKNLLNRLEYELAILSSRVQDVEDGVTNFELQVEDMERRADELKVELETETWLHWAVRTLTGIGTGPNITQGVEKLRKE
ncbi:STB2 protein [Microdochium bolleyi]|uniref:STB2 protein n=1 Tax=Microdochium bolleyi TaxID=196109 RepID=A0A136J2J5_9PEZI|nr:STB2 protein [Microdochium bolleyi]